MRVGTPTEVKSDEHRVGLTPAGVRELVRDGHSVYVQAGAGSGAGFPDAAYQAQGAQIADEASEVFAVADLVVKVKEPQPSEVAFLRPGQILFTYLHLAAARDLTLGLLESGATCVAYETVETEDGKLPLLAPMSEVAGKLAAQIGTQLLTKAHGGPGLLPGGVTGVAPIRVMVLGAGIVGRNAAKVAHGMGCDVFVYDISLEKLREIGDLLGGGCATEFGSELAIEERLPEVDLVIGAVLIPGARAPHLLSRAQLRRLAAGRVVLDVSIDQGGCFETSRPTTHSSPTYEVDHVTHSCITNLPGAVPVTATQALTAATLPYVRRLAADGQAALKGDSALARGVNITGGHLTNPHVAQAHNLELTSGSAPVTRAPA